MSVKGPPACGEDHGGRHTLVVTLAEAEALRCMIHCLNNTNGGGGSGDERKEGKEGAMVDSSKVAMALVLLPCRVVLDATENYPHKDVFDSAKKKSGDAGAENAPLSGPESTFTNVRFWDNDMFYTNTEAENLLQCIGSSSKEARVAFFEASLAARSRSRQTWIGTPVRTVFAFEDGDTFNALLTTIARVRDACQRDGIDLMQACEDADDDGNGFLDHMEMMNVFHSIGGAANIINASEMSQLVALMDADGDNAVEYGEFAALFAPTVRSTSDSAAALRTMSARPGGGGGGTGEAKDAKEAKGDDGDGDGDGGRAAARAAARAKREVRLEERRAAEALQAEADHAAHMAMKEARRGRRAQEEAEAREAAARQVVEDERRAQERQAAVAATTERLRANLKASMAEAAAAAEVVEARNLRAMEGKEGGGDKEQKSCPGGHGLLPFDVTREGYGCDGCRTSVPVGATLSSCRVCDFDLCSKCAREEEQAVVENNDEAAHHGEYG